MARKEHTPHPDTLNGRIGLIVAGMRHGIHNGYIALIAWALGECDRTIVALGPSEFLSHEERATMLRAVFGPATLCFVFLEDIAADESTEDWVAYVLNRVATHALPAPTDYYTGSDIDARWYLSAFARLNDPSWAVGDRTTFESPTTGRRLHLLDRRQGTTPPNSELGILIRQRDDGWRPHVPAKLHRFIEQHYAPRSRVALQAESDFPADVPIGTRCTLLAQTPRLIYELMPDAKWRVLREARSAALNPESVRGGR